MNALQLDANGVIVNIIVVNSLDQFPGITLVDASTPALAGAKIGDSIINGTLVPGVVPSAGPRYVTVLAFRNRFTQAEKVRIDLASIDNPAASDALRQQAAAIRVSQADAAASTYIDLDRADTRAGVQAFETFGLLDAAGRAAIILDSPIQPEEEYRS